MWETYGQTHLGNIRKTAGKHREQNIGKHAHNTYGKHRKTKHWGDIRKHVKYMEQTLEIHQGTTLKNHWETIRKNTWKTQGTLALGKYQENHMGNTWETHVCEHIRNTQGGTSGKTLGIIQNHRANIWNKSINTY